MKSPPKRRLDERLVELGYAPDTHLAGALILSGRVRIEGSTGGVRSGRTAGERVAPDELISISGRLEKYVSRAGAKLEGALNAYSIDPRECVCADIGLSTGGFTDCLLQRGAARVHGVDVAYGLVAWKIRQDRRVVIHERTNARTLPVGFFGEPIDLMAVDLSFIRLAPLVGALSQHLRTNGLWIGLVKPQFELPKEEVEEGGIVRSDEARAKALESVRQAAKLAGLAEIGAMDSVIEGADGNREIVYVGRRSS